MNGNPPLTNLGTEGSNGGNSDKGNEDSNIGMTPRKRPLDDSFDEKKYKQLLLEIVKNNENGLALVESPQFKDLTSYLNPSLPSSVTSCNMVPEFKRLLAQSSKEIMVKLTKHKGGFGISLTSGSSDTYTCTNKNLANPDEIYNYVAITVHYYDDDFVKQTHILGFFAYEKKACSVDKDYVRFLNDTFCYYGISDRILTVTDGADDILSWGNIQGLESLKIKPQICTENICLRRVLNKSAKLFLSNTYFNDSFCIDVEEIEEEHPDICISIKQLPVIIRSVVKELSRDSFLAKTFEQILDERKSVDNPKTLQFPQMDDEKSWLSTCEMIAKFLYFRDEINELLYRVRSLCKTERDDIKLEADKITDLQWNHLSIVHKIIDEFRKMVEKIDIPGQIGINDSVSFMSNGVKHLEKWEHINDYETKPFIDFAIDSIYEFHENNPIYPYDTTKFKLLYIASVLDPRYKLGLFWNLAFSDNNIHKIKTYVYELYLRYQRQHKGYLIDFQELHTYLLQPQASTTEDITEFYKSHKESFPTIYRMARDILAIPAFSPSDEMFSSIQGVMSETKYSMEEKKLISLLTLRGVIKS